MNTRSAVLCLLLFGIDPTFASEQDENGRANVEPVPECPSLPVPTRVCFKEAQFKLECPVSSQRPERPKIIVSDHYPTGFVGYVKVNKNVVVIAKCLDSKIPKIRNASTVVRVSTICGSVYCRNIWCAADDICETTGGDEWENCKIPDIKFRAGDCIEVQTDWVTRLFTNSIEDEIGEAKNITELQRTPAIKKALEEAYNATDRNAECKTEMQNGLTRWSAFCKKSQEYAKNIAVRQAKDWLANYKTTTDEDPFFRRLLARYELKQCEWQFWHLNAHIRTIETFWETETDFNCTIPAYPESAEVCRNKYGSGGRFCRFPVP